MSNENTLVHVSKCCGIPKYPTESSYNEMKSRLNEDQLETYRQRIEKFWGNFGIEFPWAKK